MVATDEKKALKFEQGLIWPIRKHIVGKNLTSYNTVVNAAYKLEQDYLNFRRGRRGVPNDSRGSRGKITKQNLKRTRGERSGSGGRDVGPIICYHCGEVGHVRTRCPHREASRSAATPQNRPLRPANSETTQQNTQQLQEGTFRTTNQGNRGRGVGHGNSTRRGRGFEVTEHKEEDPYITLEGCNTLTRFIQENNS
ncbi:hypothetical protein ACLB2K_021905 [Fragaria x ananassa]